jgi:phage baseplate assembly protein W|tara:strand:- start:19515 stop:19976 length:462 start_codon:yes stop_codon:yes gene_type:complete
LAQSVKKVNRFVDFDLAFTKIGEAPSDTDGDGTNDTLGYEIALKRDENAVLQALQNLLLTRPGEKPFIPDFGTNIVDMLFENLDSPLTPMNLNDIMRYTIQTYEPRINFLGVDIDSTKIDSNNIFLDIEYSMVGEPEGEGRARTVTVQLIRAR